MDSEREVSARWTPGAPRLRSRQDGYHPMSNGDLFNGKAFKIRQKLLCHTLVFNAARKPVSEKRLSFSFYHNLDHAMCGSAMTFRTEK